MAKAGARVQVQGYEGLRLLGAGGNAHVYRAVQTGTGENVAVKILRGAGDSAVNRRFERERSLMAELETIANVVPVLESGFTEGGDPFLVMPLYAGGSLQDQVNLGPVQWRTAVSLGRTVASAIALAHAKRILHLDVKPANVLLDGQSQPWLADFGIAEMMGNTASMSAQMMTPAFTPPERLNGEKPSEATDLYGVAATLFALLAGKAPFTGDDRTSPIAVMMAVVNEDVPVQELPEDVPDSVRNFLLWAMAKDVEIRPKSAIEMVGLLDDILLGHDVAAPALPIAGASGQIGGLSTNAVDSPLDDEGMTVVGRNVLASTSLSPAVVGHAPAVASSSTAMVVPFDQANTKPILAAIIAFVLLVAVGAVAALVLRDDGADSVASGVESSEAEETDADVPIEVETSSATEERIESQVAGAALIVPNAGADEADDSDQSDDAAADAAGDEVDSGLGAEGEPVVEDEPLLTTTTAATSTTTIAASTTTKPTTTTAAPTTSTSSSATSSTTSSTSTSTTSSSTTSTSTTSTTSTTTTTEKPKVTLEAGFTANGGPVGDEQTVSFTNITIGEATSYRWEFGDGTTGTGTNVTHRYVAPGRYVVTITATGPGGSDSATHPVRVSADTVVEPPLEAGFRASAGPPGSEQTVSFANITIGEATSFVWEFGDGTTSTAKSPTHTYAEPGTYSVTITATGPDGFDDATHPVRVDANT